MCVFSAKFKKPTAMACGGWPHATAVHHVGCKVAARRMQPPWATTFAEPPWATAVGPQIRRGSPRLVVKLKNFKKRCTILQNN
jgi:hypothetical protein